MNFHPVILAGGRGSRMYPLTEECPKALLPIGNRPLIWYPVQLLDKNGFEESIVVVRESQSRRVSEALEGFHTQYGVRMKFSLVEIPDQEDWGTADSLRTLRTKIKTEEVLVISCDLVTTVPLHLLTDYHSCHNATLTTLLLSPPHPPEEQKKKTNIYNERDIIGLTDDTQLVYFTAQADLEDYLTISRNMMKRHPHIRVYSQLKDAHLYLMKRWVLDYLAENRSISSVKGELVPHLVKHQSIETTPPSPPKEGGRSGSIASRQALQNAAKSSVDEMEKLAYQMSSFSGLNSNGAELFASKLIRCYALVVEEDLCIRVNTVPAYSNINRMLPQYVHDFQLERIHSPSTMPARGKGVSADSIVGGGVVLSEKASVKKSVIGQHCSIGDKTKIINSVLMDHVQIGEGCSVQGCVICSNVRIEERVNLKDCLIGSHFTVIKDADIRGETLVVGGDMDF